MWKSPVCTLTVYKGRLLIDAFIEELLRQSVKDNGIQWCTSLFNFVMTWAIQNCLKASRSYDQI